MPRSEAKFGHAESRAGAVYCINRAESPLLVAYRYLDGSRGDGDQEEDPVRPVPPKVSQQG